jgi:aryl-alcohol dehydrogenase (NADP+)
VNKIPRTDLDVFPLCLGGNVFGWSADERQSFAVLDAYLEGGGNFVDTADMYSSWAPGNRGGESETILGRWMKARGCRDRVVVATKVGKLPGLANLKAETIRRAIDDSLARLQTDRVDLYYAHADDPTTPIVETLRAFDELVRAGKVRWIAASNFTAARLAESLATSKREKLARYVAYQGHYNLVHRRDYEGELADLCRREELGFLPYYALAQGFLTGKYREESGTQSKGGSVPTGAAAAKVDSVRAAGARRYLDERGRRVLAELDSIASARRATMAAVALAWLLARPAVVSVIASARTPGQLAELMPVAQLRLAPPEVGRLDAASD